MSREKYDPNCPGCRPVILDFNTNRPLPPFHPAMVAVNKAYDAASEKEKIAWHAVTCLNSRDPDDLKLVRRITNRMKEIMEGDHGCRGSLSS